MYSAIHRRLNMPGMTMKSLRLEDSIVEKINLKCNDIGMSFNDYVLYAINVQLGIEDDNSMDLLQLLAKWIRENYKEDSFPDNITLQTFHHLRDTKELKKIYDKIVITKKGKKNDVARISLHRRIGRMVKTILKAKVKGRSIPLDQSEHLIQTFSFLEPNI